MIGLAACPSPPTQSGATESGSSTIGPATTSAGTTSGGGTTLGPAATFGIDSGMADGLGFVPPLDLACSAMVDGAAAHCALCDVRAQNCLDNFKCVAWAQDGGDTYNGSRCIGTAVVSVGLGEPCTIAEGLASGRDDCEAGTMCWGADPITAEGTCVPFCAPQGISPTCPEATVCAIDSLDVLALCLPPCSPLEPASCPAEQSCRYFPRSQTAACVPDAGPRMHAGTIACGSNDDPCAASEVCISAASYGGCGQPSCCTAWCDLDNPEADADCAAVVPGHVCVPVFDRAPGPDGLTALGRCAQPVGS